METQLVHIIIYLLGKHPRFFRITSMAQRPYAFRTEALDVCLSMFEKQSTGMDEMGIIVFFFFTIPKTVEAFLRIKSGSQVWAWLPVWANPVLSACFHTLSPSLPFSPPSIPKLSGTLSLSHFHPAAPSITPLCFGLSTRSCLKK